MKMAQSDKCKKQFSLEENALCDVNIPLKACSCYAEHLANKLTIYCAKIHGKTVKLRRFGEVPVD